MPHLQTPWAFISLAILCFSAILLPGIAIMELIRTSFKPLERLCYSIAAGVLLLAATALFIPLVREHLQPAMIGIVGLVELSSFMVLVFHPKGKWLECLRSPEIKLPVAVYFGMLVIGLSICFLDVKYPDQLVDGPYVFKSHRLHVKIQLLIGDFPADNYIPFAFSDFILRGISFQKEQPLCRGNRRQTVRR